MSPPDPGITRRDFLGRSLIGVVPLVARARGAHPTGGEAPRAAGKGHEKEAEALTAYFAQKAPDLLRPVKGILQHPSLAATLPGAAYSDQLWDWDTYWTARGLLALARRRGDRELQEKVCLHALGSLFNFLDSQSPDGRIPILITEKDPDPFGCLKDGDAGINQAKPIFGQLALLAADGMGSVEWLRPRFDQLVRFHRSWEARNRSPIGLLVWGNDVAVGVDNDPTTFCRPPFSSANLLLNSLYYQDLLAVAELAGRLGRTDDQARVSQFARDQGERIRKYCWDPRDRFYYTVDVQCVDRRAELIPAVPRGMATSWSCLPLRIQMFTGFMPLWCGLATPDQARDLVLRHCANPATFNAAFGVRGLSAREPMYSLAYSGNPSNWLGPVYILTNYLVWKGLKAAGFVPEAAELAEKTIRLLASDLAATGTLNEYYHPDTGAPLSHGGFLDWNLLVLEMLS